MPKMQKDSFIPFHRIEYFFMFVVKIVAPFHPPGDGQVLVKAIDAGR